MGERRLLDVFTDRLTLGRRMRILRHRAARWFSPPVRPNGFSALDDELPRPRLLPTQSRRTDH